MKPIKNKDAPARLGIPKRKLPVALLAAAGILKGKRKEMEAHLRAIRREWSVREEKEWRLGLAGKRG